MRAMSASINRTRKRVKIFVYSAHSVLFVDAKEMLLFENPFQMKPLTVRVVETRNQFVCKLCSRGTITLYPVSSNIVINMLLNKYYILHIDYLFEQQDHSQKLEVCV